MFDEWVYPSKGRKRVRHLRRDSATLTMCGQIVGVGRVLEVSDLSRFPACRYCLSAIHRSAPVSGPYRTPEELEQAYKKDCLRLKNNRSRA